MRVGEQTVTVKKDGASYTFKVMVLAPITEVKLDRTSADMIVGGKLTLKAIISPDNTPRTKLLHGPLQIIPLPL